MRTTLDIDDDVLDAARRRARDEGRSIGAVISGMARRALRAPENGDDEVERRFPTFDVGPNAKRFGLDEVKRALEDEW